MQQFKHVNTNQITLHAERMHENYTILATSHPENIQYRPVSLVAPASNEPYIQYRAYKRKKLNRYNIVRNMHSNANEKCVTMQENGCMTIQPKCDA